MIPLIRRTLNPAWYHGHRARPPFFEGWYYKLVDPTEQSKIAVIPGIFLAKNAAESHAFIQVLDGVDRSSYWIPFNPEEFTAKEQAFDVAIADNHFTQNRLQLDLHHDTISLTGALTLESLKPWPVSLRSPGVMGWYAWIPMMECFHGVLSLDHELSGTLDFNGRTIDFTGGRGYLEKDWGRAFPKGYIWFQSNHFDRTGISLSASIAIIPWIRQPFPGFIVGFLFNEKLYRFATYNGAKIDSLAITDDHVGWTLKRGRYILEMHAERSEGGILQAPTLEGMDRRIVESMNSTVRVRLLEKQEKKQAVIYEGTGRNCGLEAAGEIGRLLAMCR